MNKLLRTVSNVSFYSHSKYDSLSKLKCPIGIALANKNNCFCTLLTTHTYTTISQYDIDPHLKFKSLNKDKGQSRAVTFLNTHSCVFRQLTVCLVICYEYASMNLYRYRCSGYQLIHDTDPIRTSSSN